MLYTKELECHRGRVGIRRIEGPNLSSDRRINKLSLLTNAAFSVQQQVVRYLLRSPFLFFRFDALP